MAKYKQRALEAEAEIVKLKEFIEGILAQKRRLMEKVVEAQVALTEANEKIEYLEYKLEDISIQERYKND